MLIHRKTRRNNSGSRDRPVLKVIHGLALVLLLSSATLGFGLKLPGKRIIKHQPEALIGMTLQEQREVPLFYDTFFPVIYELNVPVWNVTDLKLEIPRNLTGAYTGTEQEYENLCNRSTSSYANGTANPDLWEVTLCPIKHKFDELLETFAREMKVFETFNASVTKLDSHFSSCTEIQPHFSNHIIDELEIELYLVQIILDCPLSDVIHHKINVSTPNKGKYAELFQLFLETYIIPRFRLIGFPKFAIPTNTLLTLHTSHLLNYLLDTFQWTTSINTCNSQRVPRLLIPQDTLRRTLEEIQDKIAKEDLKLTIPIQDLSNYYKLKLADCVTTTGNKYMVRVLVPLTKVSAKYKLVLVKSVPFLNRDTGSEKTLICHHKNAEGNFVVEGETMKPVATTTCPGSELCRLPPEGERNLYSMCIYATLINDSVRMLEYCRMTCVPIDPLNLPYIKRIRSDQFIIAGKSSADITIVCRKEEDNPTPVEDIPTDIGSLIITLPCACHIVHRSIKYEINGPCEFNLDIRPVHPKGYSYDSLLEHFFHHHLKNISDTIASSMVNQSQLLMDDGGEGEEGGNNEETPFKGISGNPKWPLYLAYVFLFVVSVSVTLGFYVVRNVYVRMGQLEISVATAGTRSAVEASRYLEPPQYSRNAPVTFSARGRDNAAYNSSGDAVY